MRLLVATDAFGFADPVWGERLEAVAALDDPSVTPEALTAFVREAVGPVRTPKTLHIVAALPRNPVGKVVRAEIRDLVLPGQPHVPPVALREIAR